MEFDIVRATLLALIQGLTEFLPISSSAHLIFPSAILGWEDQGLAFDVAVHLGTLVAVVFYFRHELWRLAGAWFANVAGGAGNADSRLAWLVILATMPAIAAGFLLEDIIEQQLRGIFVIALTTVFFGLLLLYSDMKSKGTEALADLNWKSCLIIGLAQALALIPGTSRSGITMTAALLCNLDRESASRFSFLLSIPVIAGASFLLGLDLVAAPAVNWLEMGYAMVLTAAVAFACIHFFLRTIAAIGFLPFVVYRLILGVVLFLFLAPLG